MGCQRPQYVEAAADVRTGIDSFFSIKIPEGDLVREDGSLLNTGRASFFLCSAVISEEGWNRVVRNLPEGASPGRLSYNPKFVDADSPEWWVKAFDSTEWGRYSLGPIRSGVGEVTLYYRVLEDGNVLMNIEGSMRRD